MSYKEKKRIKEERKRAIPDKNKHIREQRK